MQVDKFWVLFIALALVVPPTGFAYLYFYNPIWDDDRPVDENGLVWMPDRIDSGQVSDTAFSRARTKALELQEQYFRQDFARVEAEIAAARLDGYTPWRLGSWQAFFFSYLRENSKRTNADIDIPRAKQWIANSPDSTYPHTYLGYLYTNLGWKARGKKFSRKTPRKSFTEMKKFFNLAISQYEQALRIDPANAYASRQLIAMSRTGRFKIDIDAVFKNAINHTPDYYYLYESMLTAVEPRWGGSVDEMWEFAHKYGDAGSNHSALRRLVARAHEYHARDLAEDRSRLKRPVADANFDMDVYWKEYYKYFRDEDVWEDYAEAYRVVFEAFPLYASGLHKFGRIAEGSGRKETAFLYLEKAMQADSVYLGANRVFRFAKVLRNANYDEQANKYYRLYLDLSPDFIDSVKAYTAADYVGWQYAMKGKYRESFPYYKIVAELTPDSARSLSNYCNAFYNIHEYEAGIEYCNRAIEIDPQHAWSYHILAEIYKRTGDSEKAGQYQNKYISLTQ